MEHTHIVVHAAIVFWILSVAALLWLSSYGIESGKGEASRVFRGILLTFALLLNAIVFWATLAAAKPAWI